MTERPEGYTLSRTGLMRLENIYRSGSGAEQVQQTLGWLPLQPGMQVMDLGCGTGHFTRQIARQVAPTIVTGVDNDARVLDLARQLAAEEGVENVCFVEAAAPELPFPEGTFDLVFARLFLHHFRDPSPPLQAALRLLKPGAWIATDEVDAFLGLYWPPDPVLEEWAGFLQFLYERVGLDQYLGRKLFTLLRAHGIEDIQVRLVADIKSGTPPAATVDNVRALLQNWQELLAERFGTEQRDDFQRRLLAYLQREDTFTCSHVFLAVGRKPAAQA